MPCCTDTIGTPVPCQHRKVLPPHWYLIHVWYCVICTLTETERERRFDKRPESWADRHQITEGACTSHFL
jgi:hypothetical protein